MALNIINADERRSDKRGVKIVLVGPYGIGKTTLLQTLLSTVTLFVDLEAGDLAVQHVLVDTVRPKIWDDCRDLAVYLAGPNSALPHGATYGCEHYERVCSANGDPAILEKYDTYFIDSITVASRYCLRWATQQPETFSERTGKPDIRSAYGLLAREMIAWLTHLQHARTKNVIFVGLLECVTDDSNRLVWQPQIEGSKTARELPGIVDQVITMQFVRFDDSGDAVRALICRQPNPFSYPAKDRSGRLDLYEKPHLGELIAKITAARSPGTAA